MSGGKTFPLSLVVKASDSGATSTLAKIGAAGIKLANSLSSIGKNISLGVTAPLVGIGTASVAAFSEFEAGMANVSTLVDTSKESMAEMSAGVLALSRRTPVAISDLTDALASARGAGVAAADQFKILEGSARLGAAALGTTKDAVDVVTSSINAFGLKGAEADRVFNTLFQATAVGKMTLAQFAQGFGSVAGTVAGAGVKVDEYAAAVAALTTTGLQAPEAHTQLKAVIAGLTGQTKEAAAVFQRLKVKGIKELISTSGGLVPALERIRGVVNSNDTVLLKALGGAEAFNAVLGLTGAQAGAFREAMEKINSGVDGVSVAFDKQNRTGAATLQRLQNNMEGIAISVGRVLVPTLERLAPVLERLATRWEGLGSEGQKSVIIMAGAAAALGPTITVLGNLATVFGVVSKAVVFAAGWGKYLWMMRASIMASLPWLTAATTSVWGFTAALLANPVTWVVIALGALGAAAYQVYKNWEPLKEFFSQLWESPKEAIGLFVAWVDDVFGVWSPLTYVITHWEPIAAFFTDLWSRVVATFQSAWSKVKPIADLMSGVSIFGGEAAAAGRPLLGADRPTLGAAAAAPASRGAAQQTESYFKVDFTNVPRGVTVSPSRNNSAPTEVGVGYAMD